jgi:hypothetical protein
MEPWHMIANDHANIVSLCSDILRAMPGAGAISRECVSACNVDPLRRGIGVQI